LWLDELITILLVERNVGISENFNRILSDADSSPPGFYAFAYIWYRIAPYGTFWLKLPSVLFVTAGTYMCGLIATKLKGEKAAILATLLSATSFFLFAEAANTFRSYGLFYLLSTLMIWFYIKRTEESNERIYDIFMYGLIMTLLAYTHYFGCFIIGIFFICDIYLIIRKKASYKIIFSYLLTGFLYLPLLLYVAPIIYAWQGTQIYSIPTYQTLQNNVMAFFSNSKILLISFIFASIYMYAKGFFIDKHKLISSQNRYICTVISASAVSLITFIFIYCRHIGLDGQLFWTRYFVGILPMLLIISAIGLDLLYEIFINKAFPVVFTLLALSLGISAFFNINAHSHAKPEPWEQAIEWIYSQDEAHAPDSYLLSNPELVTYYLTHGGRRTGMPVITEWQIINEKEGSWNRLYCHIGNKATWEHLLPILEDEFNLVDEHRDFKVLVYQRKAE